MSSLDKNRPRLLIVCQSPSLRNDLVTLLTGYGYYVDYVNNRLEGLRAFRRHKHAIIIFDVQSLPRFPLRVFRFFRVYRHNALLMVAAKPEEEDVVCKYLDNGVYDIVQLPLKMDYLHYALRRMVQFNRLDSRFFYYRILLIIFLSMTPIWLLLVYFMANYW